MENNSRQSVDLKWRLRKALEKTFSAVSGKSDMKKLTEGAKCHFMIFLNDYTGTNPIAFGQVIWMSETKYAIQGYGITSLGTPQENLTVTFDEETGKSTIE